MASISGDSKIGYMYDQATDTWYAFGGNVNTAASYTWQANNTFESAVDFQDVVRAQAGVNNFQNPAARDAAIPSPTNGIVCFLRQDALGNVINSIQYYYNGAWTDFKTNVSKIININSSYDVQPSDVGAVIVVTRPESSLLSITFFPNSLPIGGKVDIYVKNPQAAGDILVNGGFTPFVGEASIFPGEYGYIPNNTLLVNVIKIADHIYATSINLDGGLS